ncbi:hypothetical protein SAMN05444397_109124 [Flavobacterium aquidurense]|jgi:hypothetical protein|uniref:Helix-turn-helix domain-containing protein n=1 Tax=Flavobacterium frigidimaris TaxID=262320 RepID=A0ABX4BPB3_FLAFR|nr:hypothetical protein [Flavobacterium frigidimaris]OXA78621.1 hypothetical protein B0A65_12875 [Flavobacterium frigidimaris]SDZ57690.1 hypothetical protein SAMN05444397_109124 [Flavobacterium aquidurense]
MDSLKPLSDFFSAVEKDFRISSTHIAIYAALLKFRSDMGFINPIAASADDIKPIAKLSSSKVYLRCIGELNEYGYIVYVPVKKRRQKSKIYFLTEQ